jgi:hypothetical protein
MKVLRHSPYRKAVRTARPTYDTACATAPAVRFILARFDVSPSLASTIASLAQLGGQP